MAFTVLVTTYEDPFSKVAYRGLPVAVLKHTPQWDVTDAWRINWPGLLIDTIVWSCLVGLPVAVFRGLKRAQRRRRSNRGQCIWCGYLLRGLTSARCPECGRALPARGKDVRNSHAEKCRPAAEQTQ
jgi:hypothetical protein